VFGKEHDDVHKIMDGLASLLGTEHRKYPPHDPLSVLLFTRDPEKALAATLHILVDDLYSRYFTGVIGYGEEVRRRARRTVRR